MKRRDEGKTSLVDFLSSIKFSTRREKRKGQSPAAECNTHFAALDSHARQAQVKNNENEDESLVRSAN
jgi:hypothetical protein